MPMRTLHDLLAHEVQDIYSAETQVADVLPRFADSARSAELRAAFEEHLEQTIDHIRRLEEIRAELGISAREPASEAMRNLLADANHIMDAPLDQDLVDASLIAAAQRVDHYEIAAYGCAAAFARRLRRHHIAELLERALDEEKSTDALLTRIAQGAHEQPAPQRSFLEGFK